MRIRNQNIAVGTTQFMVANQLPPGKRTFINITNTSTAGEIITVSVGEQATPLAGIVLTGFGSNLLESKNWDTDSSPSELAYYVVASANTATIALQERVQE